MQAHVLWLWLLVRLIRDLVQFEGSCRWLGFFLQTIASGDHASASQAAQTFDFQLAKWYSIAVTTLSSLSCSRFYSAWLWSHQTLQLLHFSTKTAPGPRFIISAHLDHLAENSPLWAVHALSTIPFSFGPMSDHTTRASPQTACWREEASCLSSCTASWSDHRSFTWAATSAPRSPCLHRHAKGRASLAEPGLRWPKRYDISARAGPGGHCSPLVTTFLFLFSTNYPS